MRKSLKGIKIRRSWRKFRWILQLFPWNKKQNTNSTFPGLGSTPHFTKFWGSSKLGSIKSPFSESSILLKSCGNIVLPNIPKMTSKTFWMVRRHALGHRSFMVDARASTGYSVWWALYVQFQIFLKISPKLHFSKSADGSGYPSGVFCGS